MYRDQDQRDFARQLRNDCTTAESRLWHFLRAEKLGVKFRRQAALGAYIVDFVCFSHRLIVELDGPQHLEERGKAHDARRTEWLGSQGFRVIRFRNQALDEDIWGVVEEIRRVLTSSPSPALPTKGREQNKEINRRRTPQL
jgi:very-short-patch-repair endonuclease